MVLPQPLLRAGDSFLTFRVIRLLGRGGAAEVHEIEHQGKRFALKVIPGLSLNRTLLERHEQEWRVLEWMVGNANVVAVHDWGTTREGVGWIRMELLHGRTIRERLTRGGPLSVAKTCLYLRQMASALDAAHRKGAVHRDIKPENVFILNDDITIKILDYGIAKVYGGVETIDGRRRGTPPYMAPEQFRGTTVAPATDVWALGIMAYEMLTGEHPFMADVTSYDVDELSNRVILDLPKPIVDVPIPIADVVMKALHKKPESRYRDGRAFEVAIAEAWKRLERESAAEEEEDEEAMPRVVALPVRVRVFRVDTAPFPDRRGAPRSATTEDAIPPSRSKIRPTERAPGVAPCDTLELPPTADGDAARAWFPFVASVPLHLTAADLPTLQSAVGEEADADADAAAEAGADADAGAEAGADAEAEAGAKAEAAARRAGRATLSPPTPLEGTASGYRASAAMLLVMMAAQAGSTLVGLGAGYLIWGRTNTAPPADPTTAAAPAHVSTTAPVAVSAAVSVPAAASAPVSEPVSEPAAPATAVDSATALVPGGAPSTAAVSFPVRAPGHALSEPAASQPSAQRSATARSAPPSASPPTARPPPERRRRLVE